MLTISRTPPENDRMSPAMRRVLAVVDPDDPAAVEARADLADDFLEEPWVDDTPLRTGRREYLGTDE